VKLSKLEVIFIGAFLSLVVLLFGSWFLRWHMSDYAIFSAIGLCFIGILLIVWHGIYEARLGKQKDPTEKLSTKNKSSKPLSARTLNALLSDKPHKCSHCGYSFSIMPKELRDGKSYMVKNPPCPSCGNVDETVKVY